MRMPSLSITIAFGVLLIALVKLTGLSHPSVSPVLNTSPEALAASSTPVLPAGSDPQSRQVVGGLYGGKGRVEPDRAGNAFAESAAQEATRSIVTPVDDSLRAKFKKHATRWPRGTKMVDGVPDWSQVGPLNPNGLTLPQRKLLALDDLVGRYMGDLTALGEHSSELASQALAHYFDSMAGSGWQPRRPLDPSLTTPPTTGAWNRHLVLSYRGYQRRVDFDSAEYQFLDDHLRTVQSLRTERDEAVRQFISTHGSVPDEVHDSSQSGDARR